MKAIFLKIILEPLGTLLRTLWERREPLALKHFNYLHSAAKTLFGAFASSLPSEFYPISGIESCVSVQLAPTMREYPSDSTNVKHWDFTKLLKVEEERQFRWNWKKSTSHTRLDTRSIFHSICQDIRTQAKDKPKSKVWQEAVVVYRVLRRQKFIYRSFRRRGCNKLLSPNWRFQTAVTHLLPSVKLGRRMIRKKPRKVSFQKARMKKARPKSMIEDDIGPLDIDEGSKALWEDIMSLDQVKWRWRKLYAKSSHNSAKINERIHYRRHVLF